MDQLCQKLIDFEDKQEKELDILINVPSLTFKKSGLYYGIVGEKKVFNILNKYCDEIAFNVTWRSKTKDFITEIDFICRVNNILLLIEVKDWYGLLEIKEEKSIVWVSCVSLNGKLVSNPRTNPVTALGGVCSDLYSDERLGFHEKINKNQIKKLIVFSRNEIDLTHFGEHSGFDIIKINELDRYLKKIKDEKNCNKSFILPNNFSYWDIAFHKNYGWVKIAVFNTSVVVDDQTIEVKNIKSIVFDFDNETALIKQRNNEKVIYGKCDFNSIKMSCKIKFKYSNIEYICFDENLHNF